MDRGLAYRKKGDLDKALTDFDSALRLNPDEVGAYLLRAFTYKKKGDTKKAEADLKKAKSSAPRMSRSRRRRW